MGLAAYSATMLKMPLIHGNTEDAVTNPSGYQYVTFAGTETEWTFFASRQLLLDAVQAKKCPCVVLLYLYSIHMHEYVGMYIKNLCLCLFCMCFAA